MLNSLILYIPWRRKGPNIPLPESNILTQTSCNTTDAPAFNTKISDSFNDRRVSDEIDARLARDLTIALTVGHHEEVETDSTSPLSAFFDYPRPRPSHANGHSNLPIRLMDTADMVKYLAEQRHLTSIADIRKGSQSTIDTQQSNPTLVSQAVVPQKTMRWRRLRIAILVTFGCILTLALAYGIFQMSFHGFAQSTVNQAYIEWQYLRFDQLTPDSFHFTAYGTLNNIAFEGILHAADYDIIDSRDNQGIIGKVSLPSINFGKVTGTTFNLQQSVVIAQQRAPAALFHNIVNDTARFSLRGSANLSWKKVSTIVQLKSLPTFSASVLDHVHVQQNNTFQLTTSVDKESIEFTSNIAVQNTGSISLGMGQVNYFLLFDRQENITARSTNTTMHIGDNNWAIEARFRRYSSESNVSHSSGLLSSLLSQNRPSVRMMPRCSSIDGQTLSYITPLAQALESEVVFSNPALHTASSLQVNEMVLITLAQTRMTYDFSITARVVLPYEIEHNMTGVKIEKMDMKTTTNRVVASLQSASRLRSVRLEDAVDGKDGSRLFDTTGPVVLDLYDRNAWANALTLQETGTQESLMRVV
ncbi:protein of unknown function [Taphrina deformans PYCC 5710]|uniref:Uncharacterized protein n=1 Tax=Taphrina deformans (strain PYCC 5710 / ATCC 11124 / CBS 356.35 / IMI 108563 / JCM 9778 / NBRC 8474) TaxID=1097556 RepID=R4XCB3_TAPDE|nr:protein of unknown function [Taphrina deformans PYCC 5710]|eukprot:CCG83461.1 protein of unknown function [Taphrina deformans PYCC 5710]